MNRHTHVLPGLMLGSILMLHILSAHAAGGFGFDRTRVVVMAGSRGGTLITAMNGTNTPYLVQSRVEQADGATGQPLEGKDGRDGIPFLVTPPLELVVPQSRLPLRILVKPDNALPQDREALFFISTKAIPSGPAPKGGGEGMHLMLALQQSIKLFWRPKGLSPDAIYQGKVAPELKMQVSGAKLQVTNPTPYFITFRELKVGGREVDDGVRPMVPPKGTQAYALPAGVSGTQVTWTIIDEYGNPTKPQEQP
ncbi:molecular chaperone [Rahnella aquatilis]|nr:molecular chaperone [Rahnella aquatilis]